jgi:prolycopene isomerase
MVHSGPKSTDYDAVVVGSGMGGLPAGALLAKAGWKVLVAEKMDEPGGLAHSFRRGPYLIDPAVHFTLDAHEDRGLDLLLKHLEVRDACELVELDPVFGVSFPDLDLVAPRGLDRIAEECARAFPHAAADVRRFFALAEKFFEEGTNLTMQMSLQDLDAAARRFPTFFAYRNATLADALADTVADERARAACAAMWPGHGLPPSRLSFYTFAKLLVVIARSGSYCVGSFQRLVDAFALALTRNGGELATSAPVDRIVVEGDHVTGVEIAGSFVRTNVVIANADAHHTLLELLDAEHLPSAYVRRLERLEPSLSAFLIFAAATIDLEHDGRAHQTFVHGHWDAEQTYAEILAGRPGGMWATVPTLTDSSLAPEGHHLFVLASLCAYDDAGMSSAAREAFADDMLELFEQRLFPGLRSSLVFRELGTPQTIERWTGSYRGAAYGWAPTPGQTGSRRLAHEAPVPGLYLSGHWTHEGPGTLAAALSSVRVATLVLHRAGQGDAAPVLHPPDMPIPV